MSTNVRSPLYGVVAPGSKVAVNLSPPVDTTVEHISILSFPGVPLEWSLAKADTVVVHNRNLRFPAPFLLWVTPSQVAIPPPNTLLMKLAEWVRVRFGTKGSSAP